MEVLLIACMLAWAAGAQSEQSKLGLSPAQRATMREQTRHEKAVRRIAEKHGGIPAGDGKAGVSPWKEPAAPAGSPAVTIPEAFRAGYRGHTPVQRVATPAGRHAGDWAARGVGWARDTGRGALQQYRKRRRAEGHGDPAPVLVPLPPTRPPDVPPMPSQPPTAGAPEPPSPAPTEEPAPGSAEPAPDGDKKGGVILTKPDTPSAPDGDRKPSGDTPEPPPAPAVAEAPEATEKPTEGVGRMAAEVSYDSAMDESDELSAMCEDDLHTYDRIKKRAEREVGRGDTLAAQVLSTGFGATIHAIVVRCREQYQIIHSAIGDLKANTVAQDEAVITAKDLLERGQGFYADIAKDMEDVAEREAYISDAVEAEDTNPEAEHYETKVAAA